MQISSRTAGWIVFILSAVYYFFNRFSGLAFIDSGELALCAYTLGVPHPTGYPLYVILTAPAAHIFSRPITGVTLMAGIMTALAGLVFFHLAEAVKHHFFPAADRHHIITISATFILLLAPVVAAQGVTNEVYGLGLLINLAVIYSVVRMMTSEDRHEITRCLILSWYLAGLSLGNHMSSVQLLPGLGIITLITLRRVFSWKVLTLGLFAFALPLTVYAVLPIRAAADPAPIANWGDVTSWENFLRHVSGWQFQVWMFTGRLSEIWANFKNFAGIVYAQFPVLILPLVAFGIYAMVRRMRLLLLFLLMVMVVNIWLGINYSIPDIDSYYLLTIASLMLLAFIGLFYLNSLIRIKYVLPGIVAIMLVWQGVKVGDENYKGDYTLPEDYALNMGRSAEFGAVVMSEIWDHQGQAFYLQQAEGIRPDLKFIDKELLRRSWYYTTIKNAYPDLYGKIADLTPPFLDEIRIFERGGEYNPQILESYYQAIINRLLIACGPAYIDQRLTYKPRGDQYLRPRGLLYKVDTVAIEAPLEQPHLIWRGRNLNLYTDWRARSHTEMIKTMASYW